MKYWMRSGGGAVNNFVVFRRPFVKTNFCEKKSSRPPPESPTKTSISHFSVDLMRMKQYYRFLWPEAYVAFYYLTVCTFPVERKHCGRITRAYVCDKIAGEGRMSSSRAILMTFPKICLPHFCRPLRGANSLVPLCTTRRSHDCKTPRSETATELSLRLPSF